jgi:hypothetical protein
MLSETALFAELTKEELFETPTNPMATNEDAATILNDMAILKDMQSTIDDEKKTEEEFEGKGGVVSKMKWKVEGYWQTTFPSASIEASPTSSCCHTHQAKSVHCTLPGPRCGPPPRV